jgi:hypothetical protein
MRHLDLFARAESTGRPRRGRRVPKGRDRGYTGIRESFTLHTPDRAKPGLETALTRLWLALRAFWATLFDADFAGRVDALFRQAPAGPDLRVLVLLQRDGRLVDFLKEDIDGYPDDRIGASVREVHRGCRKVIDDYFTIDPVMAAEEGDPIVVAPGFDAAAIRLSGHVSGPPPYQGVLKHHGWRVKSVRMPTLPDVAEEPSLIAPAEVAVGQIASDTSGRHAP